MLPTRTVPALAAAGVVLAAGLAVTGVAAADTPPATGPDTAACAQAGAAVTTANTLLADYKAFTDATAAKKIADTNLATDKGELPDADPYLTDTDTATVAARIKANEAYIADQNNTAADIAKAKQYLVFDQKLADAITADATATTTLQKAQAAFGKDGGNTALGTLAANGGLPALVAAQNKACATAPATDGAAPTTAPGTAPTTTPATTTGAPATVDNGMSGTAGNTGAPIVVGAPAGTSGAQVAVVPNGINTGRA